MSDDERDQRNERQEDDEREPVGSVSDEAVKLLGAVSEWIRDTGVDPAGGAALGQTLSGLVASAAHAAQQLGEHVDTGAPECDWCPVCRTVHLVRTTSPEVREQLTGAASSLLQALAGLAAGATDRPPDDPPRRQGRGGGRRGAPLERIDLDGEDAGEPHDPDDPHDPDEEDR